MGSLGTITRRARRLPVTCLGMALAMACPTMAIAGPAFAAAGCLFPNGTKVFYFGNLLKDPAIGSAFTAMVLKPTMAVNCNGGSSLANTPAYTITVTQVTNYNDIGGGHYVVVAGK